MNERRYCPLAAGGSRAGCKMTRARHAGACRCRKDLYLPVDENVVYRISYEGAALLENQRLK